MLPRPIDRFDPRTHIIIKGARINNLKNIDVAIRRGSLTVITGLSGSGKSSLAFDTLFAEGQRMYLESLSAYARQFLGKIEKPPVDYIRGISPAIAIQQKSPSKNPRSTVGTLTEVYDYLRLLFARVGKTFSPVSGERVSKDTVSDVVDHLCGLPQGTKVLIAFPLPQDTQRSVQQELEAQAAKGFSRMLLADEILSIAAYLNAVEPPAQAERIHILVDRVITDATDQEFVERLSDTLQTAFFEGHGRCMVQVWGAQPRYFSDRYERDGRIFELPSVNFFNFNNAYGACDTCGGLGVVIGIAPRKVIPDPSRSVRGDAIVPWKSLSMQSWKQQLLTSQDHLDFSLDTPYEELTPQQQELLWRGNTHFRGIYAFFDHLKEKQAHSMQSRILLARYRSKTSCHACQGTRLRSDAAYVKVGDYNLPSLLQMPISELLPCLKELELDAHARCIADRLLRELCSRLRFLNQVGVGYLTLDRATNTLSGGEFQRLRLATSLGSTLVGTLYILDEPTVGLHPRDTALLAEVLVQLKQAGNTVVVVEHEEAVMRVADELIDTGPDAGEKGGELVFQGTWQDLSQATRSHTARYLSGSVRVEPPEQHRTWDKAITIHGARANNLKNLTVNFPLGALTVLTGVSGSGKSSLVKSILYPAFSEYLGLNGPTPGPYGKLTGDLQEIQHLELIDQQPLGRSSRSNPVTYVKAYDAIRQVYAELPLAKQRNYKAGFFSFNTKGGRCERCQGEGIESIEMQFMADIVLPCESCQGERFQETVLEVKLKGHNIAQVLGMTVDAAMDFFAAYPAVTQRLAPLQEVGLGYVCLGQSSSVLSGGEAQRVKLATYLGKGKASGGPTFFIFDEPTTGLHLHDIQQLLHALQALLARGHSVLVVEHNLEVIKCADWVIDLGPEGGEAGGELVFAGLPKDLIRCDASITGKYLRKAMAQ